MYINLPVQTKPSDTVRPLDSAREFKPPAFAQQFPEPDEEIVAPLANVDSIVDTWRATSHSTSARGFVWGLTTASLVGAAFWAGVSSYKREADPILRTDVLDSNFVELTAFAPKRDSPIWKQMYNTVADEEGDELGSFFTQELQECGYACSNKTACNSVTVCVVPNGMHCYLKTAKVSMSTPRHYNPYCSTAILSGEPYVPGVPTLGKPSGGTDITFYMYRAKGGNSNYPLENVNTANIGALMWYLHNEVIYVCNGGGYLSKGSWGDRKFQIDKIMRYKVTMRSTTPLLKKGMNFSAFKAFDFGEATGPHRHSQFYGRGTGWLSLGEWNEFGFTPGCVKLGNSPMDQPDFQSAKAYPHAIWFSLPGPCPTMSHYSATTECNLNLPGGRCESPTGQGNSTYRVEDAGFIDIDELVGIKPKWKSRSDFCTECRSEGTIASGGGCGLNFWGPNIWDKRANQKRVNAALEAFESKYPDSPKEGDMMTPFCDYDMWRYGM